MTRWEYKISARQEDMAELGMEGWEAYAVQQHVIFYKRPLTSRKPRSTPAATRWEPDRKVPDEWKEGPRRAIEFKGLNIDVDMEAVKFANYWSSRSGHDATKVHWQKTWDNWVLSAMGRVR